MNADLDPQHWIFKIRKILNSQNKRNLFFKIMISERRLLPIYLYDLAASAETDMPALSPWWAWRL
jgi:hypothetical protein